MMYHSIDELPLLLTVSELEAALRIGRNCAYQLVKSGQIRSIHVGRKILIPRAAVEDYLNAA